MNRLLLFSIVLVLVLFIFYGGKNVPKVMKNNKEILLGIVGGLVLCSFLGMNLEGYCTIGPDIQYLDPINPTQPVLCFDNCPDQTTWTNLNKCLNFQGGGPGSEYHSSECTELEGLAASGDPLFGIYKKIREQQANPGLGGQAGTVEPKFSFASGDPLETCRGLAKDYRAHKRGAAGLVNTEDQDAALQLLCPIPGWGSAGNEHAYYFNYAIGNGWRSGSGISGYGDIFPTQAGLSRSQYDAAVTLGSLQPARRREDAAELQLQPGDAYDRNLSCDPLLPEIWLWADSDELAQNTLMADVRGWSGTPIGTVPGTTPSVIPDPCESENLRLNSSAKLGTGDNNPFYIPPGSAGVRPRLFTKTGAPGPDGQPTCVMDMSALSSTCSGPTMLSKCQDFIAAGSPAPVGGGTGGPVVPPSRICQKHSDCSEREACRTDPGVVGGLCGTCDPGKQPRPGAGGRRDGRGCGVPAGRLGSGGAAPPTEAECQTPQAINYMVVGSGPCYYEAGGGRRVSVASGSPPGHLAGPTAGAPGEEWQPGPGDIALCDQLNIATAYGLDVSSGPSVLDGRCVWSDGDGDGDGIPDGYVAGQGH